MSQRMEQAITELRRLPEADQDGIAAMILETIESDRRWDELFARPESVDLLGRMADQALAETQAGRAEKLDLTKL